jgi:hypothetical protein
VILYGFNGPPNNVPHHLDHQMLALTIVGLAATLVGLWFTASCPRLGADDHDRDAREWNTGTSIATLRSMPTLEPSQITYRPSSVLKDARRGMDHRFVPSTRATPATNADGSPYRELA